MVTLNMETGDALHEGKTLFLLLSTMCFRLNSFAKGKYLVGVCV